MGLTEHSSKQSGCSKCITLCVLRCEEWQKLWCQEGVAIFFFGVDSERKCQEVLPYCTLFLKLQYDMTFSGSYSECEVPLKSEVMCSWLQGQDLRAQGNSMYTWSLM